MKEKLTTKQLKDIIHTWANSSKRDISSGVLTRDSKSKDKKTGNVIRMFSNTNINIRVTSNPEDTEVISIEPIARHDSLGLAYHYARTNDPRVTDAINHAIATHSGNHVRRKRSYYVNAVYSSIIAGGHFASAEKYAREMPELNSRDKIINGGAIFSTLFDAMYEAPERIEQICEYLVKTFHIDADTQLYINEYDAYVKYGKTMSLRQFANQTPTAKTVLKKMEHVTK